MAHALKPIDLHDAAEVAVAEFFKDRKPGWTVEWPAPSIERVSCYVLKGGVSVIVTEYKGCSFSVFGQMDKLPEQWADVLDALKVMDSE